MTTQRRRVKFLQHLQPELTCRRHAQAVAVRAPAVEKPVPRNECAAPGFDIRACCTSGGDRMGGDSERPRCSEEGTEERVCRDGSAKGSGEVGVRKAGGVWAESLT